MEVLDKPIGGYIDKYVRDIEANCTISLPNRKCDEVHTKSSIEHGALQVEVFSQTIDSSITNIRSIDKGTQPYAEQPWQDMEIQLFQNASL